MRISGQRLQLLFRDLAATAALLSMVVSGEVPGWALGTFGLTVTLALLNVRPFARFANPSSVLLVFGAVALYSNVAAGRVDLVVAACTFAGLLTCHRLMSAPSPSTDSQVYLTSLLMVAGGAALSGELLFAACVTAFGALATLSLGLQTVEQSREPGEVVPLRPLLGLLAAGALASTALGILLFVAFPRLSWNVAAHRSGAGLGRATTGMSDGIRLSGAGRIKTNPRVVFRAALSPDPKTKTLEAYWVGQTLESFNGIEWSSGGSSRLRALDELTLGPGGGKLVFQQIETLPAYGSRTVVGLDRPLGFSRGFSHLQGSDARVRFVEQRGEQVRFEMEGTSYSYRVLSRPAGTGAQPLSPASRARALQLPPTLDARVAALATSVRGTEKDPLSTAKKLEAHLQRNYSYTLELAGPVADPLANFLFERKSGHCEHFATALAILLRTQGIPARVVTGFYGGRRAGMAYLVRAGDAHAWTEAYIDGRGYVRLDSTPEDSRSAEPNAVLDFLLQEYESLQLRWQSSVLDYSMKDQAALVERLPLPGSGTSPNAGPALPKATTVMAVFGLLFLVGLLWRLRGWRQAPTEEEATRFLAELERLLKSRGHPSVVEEGVEALSRRLEHERHPAQAPLRAATRRYLEARFGGRPLLRGEARALSEQVRQAT